jgi:cytochrome c553
MRRTLLLAAVAGTLAAAAIAQAPKPQAPAAQTPAKQAPATQAPAAPAAATAPTPAPQATPAAQPSGGKPNLEQAQKTASEVCLACHGPGGNSVVPANPSLAGQPAEYITLQLAHFKSGVRVNPIMQGMASTLDADQMKAIGVYYWQQKPKPQAAKDAALVAAGQKLFRGGDSATGTPACSACHLPSGAGVAKNYPRLAGQHADYTYAQLKAFKSGERGADKGGKDVNGTIMATIAQRMTDAQMKAVAEYASGLR